MKRGTGVTSGELTEDAVEKMASYVGGDDVGHYGVGSSSFQVVKEGFWEGEGGGEGERGGWGLS